MSSGTAANRYVKALRAGGHVGMFYTITAFGGAHQLEHFGTDEQKHRWLVPLARGEIFSAVCITEPLVGSDASAIALRSRLDESRGHL